MKQTSGEIILSRVSVSSFARCDYFGQKRPLCLDLVKFTCLGKLLGPVRIVEETNLPSFGPWVCSEGSTCRLIFPGSCILDKIFCILDRIFYILDINILDFHRKYIIDLRWSWHEAYNCFAFCNHSRSPHLCTWQSIIHLLTWFPWISSRVTNRFSWITNKSISLPGHPMPGIP